MYSSFIDPEGIDELTGTMPSVFAKISLLWTSLLYIFANKRIKNRFFKAAPPVSEKGQNFNNSLSLANNGGGAGATNTTNKKYIEKNSYFKAKYGAALPTDVKKDAYEEEEEEKEECEVGALLPPPSTDLTNNTKPIKTDL
jgi:hypothetical protein